LVSVLTENMEKVKSTKTNLSRSITFSPNKGQPNCAKW